MNNFYTDHMVSGRNHWHGRAGRRRRSNGAKTHLCPRCGNGYAFLKSLRRHLRYECGLAPRFRCPYCGVSAKQRAHVSEHVKRKHPDQKILVLDTLSSNELTW